MGGVWGVQKGCLPGGKFFRVAGILYRVAWSLEASGAAGCVVEGQADEGLAVVDLVGGDEGEGLGEREAQDLDLFVGLGLGLADTDVAGEVDLHPLTEEAGAGEVFGEQGPLFGTVAGLFDHLALGSGERSFVGLDAACG